MSNEEFEDLFGNTPFENIEKIKKYINENYIEKSKIRDKIELFELEIETLKTLYPKTYTRDDDYKLNVFKICILKELLEEEK